MSGPVHIPAFFWTSYDANTPRVKIRPRTWELYAGSIRLATLTPCNGGKHHQVNVWLPETGLAGHHPEEKAKEVAELICWNWFKGCWWTDD